MTWLQTLDYIWVILMFLAGAGAYPIFFKILRAVLPDKYDDEIDTAEDILDEIVEVMQKAKTKNETFYKIAEDSGNTKAALLIAKRLLT